MRHYWTIAITCILTLFVSTLRGQEGSHENSVPVAESDAPVMAQPLSPQAMDALVAGIAFYPDTIIEQILDAAQYPDALNQAAKNPTSTEASDWPESVQALTVHPEILQQLDQNAVITARLALAARTQLADVWRAVDRVRTAFEQSQAKQAETPGTAGHSTTTAAAPYAYPSAAFIAGYWTAQVVDEMHLWYQATGASVAYGQGSVIVTGPAGNTAAATLTGAAGYATVGDTTVFDAAGAGSVTTSNGVVVEGQGAMAGSATQTANGGSYHAEAAGSVSSNTGFAGSGQHSAEGVYTVNPDGSTDFYRHAATSTSSTAGSSHIQHSGSGTYTGTGTGSFEGSTDIQSTHGDASVNTSVADGQLTSTLSTDQGQQSVTLGDQQFNNASASQPMTRPESVPPSSSRFSKASAQQWKPNNQVTTEVWNRLNQPLGNHSSAPSLRTDATSAFSRTMTGSGLPANSSLKNFAAPSVKPSAKSGFPRPTPGTGGVNQSTSTKSLSPSAIQTPKRSTSPTQRGGGNRRGRR